MALAPHHPDGGPGPLETGSGDFEVLSVIFSTCCCDSGPVSLRSPPSSARCQLDRAVLEAAAPCCAVPPLLWFRPLWVQGRCSPSVPCGSPAVCLLLFLLLSEQFPQPPSPQPCISCTVFLECVSFLMACLPVAVTSAPPCGVTGLRRLFQSGEPGVVLGLTFTGLSDSGENSLGQHDENLGAGRCRSHLPGFLFCKCPDRWGSAFLGGQAWGWGRGGWRGPRASVGHHLCRHRMVTTPPPPGPFPGSSGFPEPCPSSPSTLFSGL